MEAPVNILVESPDAEKAKLVGQAIAQGLGTNFGFQQVMHAHIVTDTPGFRAWTASTEEQTQESLLDAMKAHNPEFFQTPVTVLSRVRDDTSGELDLSTIDQLALQPPIKLNGIGEEGVGFEELRQKAWEIVEPTIRPRVEKLARDIADMFDTTSVEFTAVQKF